MIRIRPLLFISLAGFLMVSCYGTKVSDSWSDMKYSGKINNIYIIGIVIDDLNRMIFENTFKIRLANEGVKSTPSHYDFSQTLENDYGSIIPKEQSNVYDAVLLTRVVDQRTQAVFNTRRRAIRYVPKPSLKSGQVFERFPDDSLRISSYSTGYTAISKPSTPMKFVVLTVEFLLYDLQTEELIWSANMETDLESNREKMMQKIADEAVKDLKLKGLI